MNNITSLNDALNGLIINTPHLKCAARLISAGDEFSLTPEEKIQMQKAIMPVRRASAAARIVARELLVSAGAHLPIDLCNEKSGAPRWPPGFIGSISHDEEIAVAAVSRCQYYKSIGVDVEPSTPLPEELVSLIATNMEISQMKFSAHSPKLLFCIKEAVYKATNVLDQKFLDYHDVEFCFRTRVATVRNGLSVKVHTLTNPRFIALAVID